MLSRNRTVASSATRQRVALVLLALVVVHAPQAQQDVIGEEAEKLFRQARQCIENDDSRCGREALAQASRLDLSQWEAAQLWNLRGLVELASGNASQAAAAYERALGTAGLPLDLRRQIQLALAQLYVRSGEHERALEVLDDATVRGARPRVAPPSSGEWLPILTVAPDYPAEAAAAGLEEGYVVVAHTVTASGTVENPRSVETSSELFVRPAFEAARKWRYLPRVESGEPVDVPDVTTVFRFRLDDYLERVTSAARPPPAAENAAAAEPGPYEVVSEQAFGLPGYLVFRPAGLDAFPRADSLPAVIWANGGCARNGGLYAGFLSTLASHGFLVVTTAPVEPTTRWFATVEDLRAALDWVEAEATREGSPLKGKIATDRIAAMGQSCGGELAVSVGTDPRVATTGVFNSDVFLSHTSGAPKNAYLNLHGPVLLLNGHELDHTMAGSAASFDAIDQVPVFYGARHDAGHFATFLHPGGGEFANVASSWLRFTLKEDTEAGKMFVGASCGLCTNDNWETRARRLE
jgi:TonB family protein